MLSSHGAGDVFAGALAARLSDGEVMRDALRYAAGAAALHVATKVAERSALERAVVNEFLARHAGCTPIAED